MVIVNEAGGGEKKGKLRYVGRGGAEERKWWGESGWWGMDSKNGEKGVMCGSGFMLGGEVSGAFVVWLCSGVVMRINKTCKKRKEHEAGCAMGEEDWGWLIIGGGGGEESSSGGHM